MKRSVLWAAPVAALLALVMQAVTLAHAVEHGDAPHDHDGQPCLIQTLTDRQDDVLAPSDPVLPMPAALAGPQRPDTDQSVRKAAATLLNNRDPPLIS